MTTIATLAVKMVGDISGYAKAMHEAEVKTRSAVTNIGNQLKNVGGQLSGWGQQATAALTLPIAGMAGVAINAASDLDETRNKVGVVFGDMSQSVMDWSANSATAMGQSQQQALEAAGTYGNLMLTMGMAQQPAADMSMQMVQLASDMASFNNADPSEVLLAIRSGLIGESEPLRRFGVNLSEAAVQAKAMQMGLADSKEELTDADKLQARYALIMQQTATAQGDFARTADGVANSTRIAKAQLADAAAVLGAQLLPYALQFVRWVSELVNKFQALTPEQQKWILILAGIAAAIGPVLMVIGGLVTMIGTIMTIATAITTPILVVVGVIVALIALAALLYTAWTNNWGGIQQKTEAVVNFIKGVIDGGMQFINDLTTGKLGWLSQLWSNTWNTISVNIQTFLTNIKLIFLAFQAGFQGDWYQFGALMRQAWDNAMNALKNTAQNAWNNIKLLFSQAAKNIGDFFKNTDWGAVGEAIIDGIAKGISGAVAGLVNAAKNAADAALNAAKGFLGIRSPSIKFEREVGWQMAAGTARGLEMGLDRLIPPAFGMLTPSPVMAAAPTAVSVAGVKAPGALGANGMNDPVLVLLQAIAENGKIDYEKLARTVRDAVLMRTA